MVTKPRKFTTFSCYHSAFWVQMTGSLTSLPGRLLMHSQLWLPWQVFASHVDKSRCVKLHGSSPCKRKWPILAMQNYEKCHSRLEINEHQWTSYRITPSIGSWSWYVLVSPYHASHGSHMDPYGLMGTWIVQLSRLGIRTMLESLLGWKPSIGKSPHQSTEPCHRSVCLGCSNFRLFLDPFCASHWYI